MNVHELIADLERHVPMDAPPGTRHRASGQITTAAGSHTVVLAAHVDARSRRREHDFCDGTRVPRHVLLRLTCAETECAHARLVRAQWDAFKGRSAPARRAEPAPQAASLMHEVPLSVAGHACLARPARFRCFTPCPNQAHPPLWIEKSGYDLFEDGRCVGGGVTGGDGPRRPRLPSIPAAEAYLLARHVETLATLNALAARGGRPGQEDGDAARG